jgi:hypothetical protein
VRGSRKDLYFVLFWGEIESPDYRNQVVACQTRLGADGALPAGWAARCQSLPGTWDVAFPYLNVRGVPCLGAGAEGQVAAIRGGR